MSFTMIALQGKFTNPDGTPASGTICATPTAMLENFSPGVEPQTAEPVCGLLDAEGRIVGQNYQAMEITATDDPNTTPIGASYIFGLKLDGQPFVEFTTPVPSNPSSWGSSYEVACYDNTAVTVADSPTIVLVDLVAGVAMVGAQITGPGIDGTAHIISVNPTAKSVTIDSPAIASDAGVTIEGGCIPLMTLRANAL